MKPEIISDAMGRIDDAIIEETNGVRQNKKAKKRGWVKWAACAACLALVLAVGIPMMNNQQGQLKLSDNSVGVTVRYTDNALAVGGSPDLKYLTEDELFTYHDTVIFKGAVSEIKNIELDFNGTLEYRAVAKIKVEEVYRGPCAVGDTVSVLLPGPVSEGVWVEDTETVSAMRAGSTGIFMPVIYDETSIWEQNGAKLAKKDIADCGFADGVRYAFVETANGLVFDRGSYASIAGAESLEEVENYILSKISLE